MTPESAVPQPERVAAFFRKHRTGLVTLVFTDVAGSTQPKAAWGDHAGVALIQSDHALMPAGLTGPLEDKLSAGSAAKA